MISVLTLTYKRHHLLEEAMQSFLSQTSLDSDDEMVIINDNSEVDYVFDHPNIRIINHKERFPSISAKIEWGYKQCKNNYIYRLDDDDLLTPWALENAKSDILAHPNYEIYRSAGMYFFSERVYHGENSNVNNGNIYTKAYLDRIKFPDFSIGEDAEITFSHNATIYQSQLKHTMIYRWGMNTLHISGMGQQPNEVILAQADKVLNNTTGTIELHPQFLSNYYEQMELANMKVFIQIGANVGHDDFQQMIRNSPEKLRVILVEPNKDMLEELKKNYQSLSAFHNISIYPYGISTANEQIDMYMYGDIYGNYSLLNRRSHPMRDVATTKKVNVVTFKQMCADFNLTKIDYLSLDTEGMDYEILDSIDLSKITINNIDFEEWIHEADDLNNKHKTGPSFFNEVIVPKFKDYDWNKVVIGGMDSYKLTKKN